MGDFEEQRKKTQRPGRAPRKIVDALPFCPEIYLNENELKKLHDFEEDCMDDLSRRKSLHSTAHNQNQHIRECAEGMEKISFQINELSAENTALKSQIGELLARFYHMEKLLKSSPLVHSEQDEANKSSMQRPKYLFKSLASNNNSICDKSSRILPRAQVFPMATRRLSSNTSPEISTPSTILDGEISMAFLMNKQESQTANANWQDPLQHSMPDGQNVMAINSSAFHDELTNMMEIASAQSSLTPLSSEDMPCNPQDSSQNNSRTRSVKRDSNDMHVDPSLKLSASTPTVSPSSSSSSSAYPSIETLNKIY